MAGGTGSRLHPLTIGVNKHLLPIYNKPLIYYPLTTLMLAGIREILLISSPSETDTFRRLLGDGNQFGIEISYATQAEPKGIAEGILVAQDFTEGHNIGFILGDNVFHGVGLGRQLSQYRNILGAQIFAYHVKDPRSYGVVEIGADDKVISLEEKPKEPKSQFAITGLYFYDERAASFARQLKPSARGELEITDLNQMYLELNELNVAILSRGTAWLDTGTFELLYDASSYIRLVEERQGEKIGDPTDAALSQGWI